MLKGAEHKKSLPNSHDCLRCVPLPLHLSRTLWNPYRWWVPMFTRIATTEFWMDSSTFPTKGTSVKLLTWWHLKELSFIRLLEIIVVEHICTAYYLQLSLLPAFYFLLFHCVASVHLSFKPNLNWCDRSEDLNCTHDELFHEQTGAICKMSQPDWWNADMQHDH